MSARRRSPLHPTVIATVACVLATSSAAFADDGWIVRAGFESGGDKLFEGRFTNGDEASIKTGDGLHFEIGLRRGLAGPEWETDLTAGYKSDSENASNGDVSFTRVTLNAMQYYRYSEQIRVGAGATYHLDPEVDIDVPGLEGKGEAKSALGFMLAADYLVAEQVELGIRATRIDYEFETGTMETRDGNSVGGYLTYRF